MNYETDRTKPGFTWVETYKALAEGLRAYKNRQNELIDFMTELRDSGIPTISTNDKDENGNTIPLAEIDPFTFFANFNRGIRTEYRVKMIRILVEKWDLSCDIPSDFSGIPVMNNQQAWFMAYKREREPNAVSNLWKLFEEALDRNVGAETFNEVLTQKYVRYNLTMGLFWIAPDYFLNLDSVNREYLAKNGITINSLTDFATYQKCMQETRNVFGIPFYQISHNAWLSGNEPVTQETDAKSPAKSARTWLYAPGQGGQYWEEFYNAGIMAIGWEYLGDIRKYSSKEAIAEAIREHDNDLSSSKKNNATTCHSFCSEMNIGDVVYAKIGRDRIIGKGIIASDYSFDESRTFFNHVRKIEWVQKGQWTVTAENHFALKTITDVTRFTKFTAYLGSLSGDTRMDGSGAINSPTEPYGASYWWLNCNPRIWDLEGVPVGTRQTYTSRNTQGHKRQKFKYFSQVKEGDLLLGYVASPLMSIVAVCKITKPLSQTAEGEAFEFEKIEDFQTPVPLKELRNIPELAECEPIRNNQGSLFSVTEAEFEIIRAAIDETNEGAAQQPIEAETYTIEQLAADTLMRPAKLDDWLKAVERKGQAVFYGPPGTGKTFIAERLAKHLVSGTDGVVEVVQFHPAYTYEEFMQGIRPETDVGGNLTYVLKPGVFHRFCSLAKNRKGPCVLIIDEINRANLARVFGELMYLLEYRDRTISLPGGGSFSIPTNVRIIGTMNTADRSIALVDFALRRRFAFLDLDPEYDTLMAHQKQKGFDASGLVAVLRDVNSKINDKNYSLGISFFLVESLAAKIQQIWKMEIETYLEEYFFTQPQAIDPFRWEAVKSRVLNA